MKRRILNKSFLKQTALAVPAAALMLGTAQAGTTVGLNVQTWTYADGGAGYQTPVSQSRPKRLVLTSPSGRAQPRSTLMPEYRPA